MTNLALLSLGDLKIMLAENEIKNEVWDAKRAAVYLNISQQTLKKEAAKGNIPGTKVGDAWRFSSLALYEFVKGA